MKRTAHNLRRVLTVALGLVVAYGASVLLPVSRTLELTPDSLPADGRASARLIWTQASLYGQPIPLWPWTLRVRVISGAERVRLVGATQRGPGPGSFEIGFTALGPPGPVILELDTGWSRSLHRVEVIEAAADRDADGIPDAAELANERDRRAFREWFVAIAEAQFYAVDPRWQPIHRDCAGLARFAYKEALRSHDRAWLAQVPYLHRIPGEDVGRFHFPDVPRIGERLFRIRSGSFDSQTDPTRDFSLAAGAQALWEYNTVFVSRDPDSALAGDLLFFRERNPGPEAMHTMILVDPPGPSALRRVVYHTGADDTGPGEVRLVRLADLNAHRDDRWHVRPDNPNFLGFYRWKILEGGRP